MAPPVVLVVYSELGYLFALSHELHYRGIDSVPALTTVEARSMMMHLQAGGADLLKATFRDPEVKEPERIPYCADVIGGW